LFGVGISLPEPLWKQMAVGKALLSIGKAEKIAAIQRITKQQEEK
jgi:hypothetical protein